MQLSPSNNNDWLFIYKYLVALDIAEITEVSSFSLNIEPEKITLNWSDAGLILNSCRICFSQFQNRTPILHLFTQKIGDEHHKFANVIDEMLKETFPVIFWVGHCYFLLQNIFFGGVQNVSYSMWECTRTPVCVFISEISCNFINLMPFLEWWSSVRKNPLLHIKGSPFTNKFFHFFLIFTLLGFDLGIFFKIKYWMKNEI